ncbi:MAG: plasmid pRiA4b ORF-3 family protein, partial [Bacillota bacterium]
NWRHEVDLEKILPAEEGRRYPVCVDGARHRPPEDVGGVSGYEEFLRIISDPGHPEHDDYLVWAEKDTGGRKFDPEYFYINEVNRALAKVT